MDFKDYQVNTVRRFQEILKEYQANGQSGYFDEQALPAYTNPNPLMRWLFWQRLKVVMQFLEDLRSLQKSAEMPSLGTTLDFGCGLGAMLPYLNKNSDEVVGVDLDVKLVTEIAKREGWSKVSFCEELEELEATHTGKFNVILSLDVLEHVHDLDEVLKSFQRLLAPDGVIIISGPSESLFYKLGRKLAGYSGDYHCRNIYDIIDTTKKYFSVGKTKTLVRLLPLFEIFEAKNNSSQIE